MEERMGEDTRPYLAALTGSIGSGKSTVAAVLAGLGARIIDADVLAREAVVPGSPALEKLVARFGTGILAPDGSLRREALADIIFSDENSRRDAEEMIHPAVRSLFRERLAAFSASRSLGERAGEPCIVVYVVPLLFEARIPLDQFDAIMIVSASEEILVQRLVARGLTQEDALRRLRAQMPAEQKERMAQIVIKNDGSREELTVAVTRAWKQICSMAKGG